MLNTQTKYRYLDDVGLISFCTDHLSYNAQIVLGVFVDDSNGTVKIDTTQYAYLIELYLEIGAQTGGQFNGTLDFDVSDLGIPIKTDNLM